MTDRHNTEQLSFLVQRTFYSIWRKCEAKRHLCPLSLCKKTWAQVTSLTCLWKNEAFHQEITPVIPIYVFIAGFNT